ncbi:MAG: hypothetical protein ACI9R3_002640 [Verrucomicrobiales bacterium]|jgi:hypothetical protein
MATNLDIEPALLDEAVEVGGHRTKRAAVEEALTEYVRRRKQLALIELFGEIDYDPDYDPKKLRRRPCES